MNYIFEQDGNYVNFNGGANVYRLHKDSICVQWHYDQTGDLFFNVYDNYFQVKAGDIGSVTVGGHMLTTAADFGTYIVVVFPGLAGSSSSSSYLVYTALLSQTGTDNPVATELANTIGQMITWARTGVGIYQTGVVFNPAKTYMFPFGSVWDNGSACITISDESSIIGYVFIYLGFIAHDLIMNTVDSSFAAIELSTLLGTGNIALPEIRVYP